MTVFPTTIKEVRELCQRVQQPHAQQRACFGIAVPRGTSDAPQEVLCVRRVGAASRVGGNQ